VSGTCRYCLATYGDIYEGDEVGCGHGEREAGVARQLATFAQEGEPTDAQIGGFMEDAELICSTATEPEPKVTHYNARTMRFRVGEHRFRVDEDGYLGLVERRVAIHQQDTDRAAR
jgi:hypothetical protein